jgi:hypothetical protein
MYCIPHNINRYTNIIPNTGLEVHFITFLFSVENKNFPSNLYVEMTCIGYILKQFPSQDTTGRNSHPR